MDALTGFERVTMIVSFASMLASPTMLIGIVFSLSPGRKVIVPRAVA
jgi:hypothetical protein